MIAIGVPAEGDDEPRIGLTPETVKKLVKAGAEVTVRSGAGLRSHFSDVDLQGSRCQDRQERRGGRRRRRCRAHRAPAAAQPRQGDEERRCRGRHARPVLRRGRPRRARQNGHFAVRHGADAAHLARADHGRAVLAVEPRGLQGGGRCGRRLRARAADDDDGGGHRACRESLRHGRGRRRAAGHRHGAASRRHRHRDGCAPGGQGAGGFARRQVHRGRGRGVQAGGDLPAAMPRKCPTPTRRSRPSSSPSTSRTRTSSSPRR